MEDFLEDSSKGEVGWPPLKRSNYSFIIIVNFTTFLFVLPNHILEQVLQLGLDGR